MKQIGTRIWSWRRWQKAAVIGGVAVVAIGAVFVRDVQRIDPTSGGYSAPYDDYRGEPIDWLAQEHTDDGFRDDGGILLNASLDCTSGQIRIHVGPVSIDYRKLSERAIVVHKPHVPCIERGFEPQWNYPETDIEAVGTGASRG